MQPAGQSHGYKPGELVDYHWSTTSNDISGWKGPAKISDATNISRGEVTVRFQRDLPIEVRLQDIRRHLDCLVCIAAPDASPGGRQADTGSVRTVVDSLRQGALCT